MEGPAGEEDGEQRGHTGARDEAKADENLQAVRSPNALGQPDIERQHRELEHRDEPGVRRPAGQLNLRPGDPIFARQSPCLSCVSPPLPFPKKKKKKPRLCQLT